ncbi:MAG TPA: ABC transporter permease [Acidobacteriota bacterium]|jgi:phospholipid/cholesterol/gamma-HCH transport system permease protein|nr:ABC transporter permease [Acidobacteriota bacterium]
MNFIFRAVYEVQEFFLLSVRAVSNVFRKPRYYSDALLQMDAIGVGSLMIVALTGFFTGAVLALQSAKSLKSFGAVGLTGQLVSLSLIKELGPVLTALMIAGRNGSGIASELGSMVVTEQISAMRALGTDPTRKLVTPRVFAATTMVPLLTVMADLFGLLGGWLVSAYRLRLSTNLYWSSALKGLDYKNVVEGLSKPFIFGFIIAIVGCYCGLRTYGGTQGVGRSTTQAVVLSSILVIAADFFVGKIMLDFLYH